MEISLCCGAGVARVSDTKEDKIFCMNCGQHCYIKINRVNRVKIIKTTAYEKTN